MENQKREKYSSYDYNKKPNYALIFIVIFVLTLGLIGGAKLVKDSLEKPQTTTNKGKVELNYTDTTNKIKEGIYITDVSEIVENVMPSIVSITSKTLVSSGILGPGYYGNQYSEGAGSGIIISKSDTDLMILTNNHVIEGAKELSVQFINEKSYDAQVLGTSERRDIAIITVKLNKIDSETLSSIRIATMGNSNELKVGNGVIAIGNALGYGQSVTTGVVSALNRAVDNYASSMIQIDAAINGGNSGGALLNNKGEVVGINSAKYSSNAYSSGASIEGMGFAIPISDVSELITALMNGEKDAGDPVIGVEGYIITAKNSSTYNIPVGFYIAKIVSGSGADKAELAIGNVITKIENKKVEKMTDLQAVLATKKKGDKVKLTVKYPSGNEYKEKTVTVTLS